MKLNLTMATAVLAGLLITSSCQKNATRTGSDNGTSRPENSLTNFFSNQNLSSLTSNAYWDPQDDLTAGQAEKSNPNLTSFTYLEAALDATGLDAALEGLDAYTLFAPSDQAFINAGFPTIDDLLAIGNDALSSILLYHVISGAKIPAADVPAGPNAEVASLNSAILYLTKKTAPELKVHVNGAGVYIPDYDNGNGIIHCINKVLLPPAGNLVESAVANPDLSYLVAAVLRASEGSTNVAEVLSGDGPFTLFAPTNDAFIAAGFATIDDINAADPDALAAILTYHVIASRVFAIDIPSAGLMPVMLNTQTTDITTEKILRARNIYVKGAVNSSGSMVTKKNIVSSNGVTHIIDQVLLPN